MNVSEKPTTKTSPSPDDLSQQIETLRADLMKIAATISDDMSGGIEKAGHQIGQTGRDARETATNTVLAHPLTAVAVAAGIGLLFGLIARKS